MKFIKNVTDRTKNGRKMGLFLCPHCKGRVKRPLTNGARQNGCGCVRKWGGKPFPTGKNGRAKRTCLMCGKKFISRGIENRRCPACELKITQAVDATYYEPPVYGRTIRSNIKVNSEN
jgi:hypothetical protein